ncbi:hypothetical protein Ga0074115_1344 [endosymbiont of Ridgeia piscesae]|uniref:Hemerythrin-like domain-containing protein n=2 Tax=endosymbiont of Ridgeia piscesae TaxID=54398 RepID=A0A0T5Z9I5_9GAMM|nr:hypothetical protein Ga0074115_1344 [endosymbiont of Ridgeia piscesae]KRT59538.1 hypothetical protein Ga0076813_155328 [endosymbiont of Ridgeia piscesae]
MNMIDSIEGRHAEMLQIISDLRAMMTMEQLKILPTAKTAHQLICELSDKMKAHIADQDAGIYPDLLVHEDAKLKSMAWGFINGQKPMRSQFDAYHQKWLKECGFNFTEEFLSDTHELFKMIEGRIERETKVLVPTLRLAGMYEQSVAAH